MAEMRLDTEKNRLIVTPMGQDEMTVLLKLPSRRWMKRAGNFVVPLTRMNASILVSSGIYLPDHVRSAVRSIVNRPKASHQFPKWYVFKTQPFPDQMAALLKAYQENVFALFMRMGTGKSKVFIDYFTAAFFEKRIDLAVIICPLTVAPVWLGETGQLQTHCPAPLALELVDSSFDWTDVQPKRDRMTWLVVGVESLSQGRTYEKLLPLFDHYKVGLGVDESSRIKNHKAIRTDRIIEIGKKATIKGIGTGTPATKNLMDLYSQFEFLDPNIIGIGDFYAYRNRYAIMGGFKKKQVEGHQNVEELTGLIEPYVYICDKPKGMPEQLWNTRHVELDPEQKEMYHKVKNAEIESVKVANVLNRMQRLQEITAGFLREDPKIITVKGIDPQTGLEIETERKIQGDVIWRMDPKKNPKIIELLKVLDDMGDEQLIIWSRHLIEIENTVEALKDYGPILKLTGEMAPEARGPAIEAFQQGKYRIIVSNQQIGGIGHTMTAAHLAFYFSNTYSLEDRLQSEDRIHRIGQTEGCYYVDYLAKKTVDYTVWGSMVAKKDLDIYVRDKIKEAGAKALAELFGDP